MTTQSSPEQHVKAFARAVAIGAAAGTIPVSLFLMPIALAGLSAGQAEFAVVAFLAPPVISFLLTLLGMIVIGLPVTILLKALDGETRTIYTLAGGVFGFCAGLTLPSLLVGYLSTSGLTGIFGALAGSIAGRSWGHWREFGHAGSDRYFADEFR